MNKKRFLLWIGLIPIRRLPILAARQMNRRHDVPEKRFGNATFPLRGSLGEICGLNLATRLWTETERLAGIPFAV